MIGCSCIVVAGGRSVRMGEDKRMLMLGGRTFFEVALDKAGDISTDVIVSLGDDEQAYDVRGVTVVIDEVRGRGPLFGLVSALKMCKEGYVAVMPVDAPMLEPMIFERMYSEFQKSSVVEGVVPRSSFGMEPLFGLYRVSSFLSACEAAISSGGERVRDAVSQLENVVFLDLEEFRGVDPKLLSFHNVNTPFDFERLMEMVDE